MRRRVSAGWVAFCIALMVACVVSCQMRFLSDLAWYLFWIAGAAVLYPFLPLVRPPRDDERGNGSEGQERR